MNHVCLSSRPDQLQRWKQAFPGSRIVASWRELDSATALSALCWFHVEGFSDDQQWQEVAQLKALTPDPRLLFMTAMPDNRDAMLRFQQGAVGYCHVLSTPQLFQQIALIVSNGGLWLGKDFKQSLVGALGRLPVPSQQISALGQLSVREQEVARKVAAGLSNREIADTLCIAERTVKAHLTSIFEKLGIRDRLQLAVLISPED